MADDQVVNSHSDGDGEFRVTLPVQSGDFAEFVKNIIGGKDKLSYSHENGVVVSPSLVRDLFSAIDYRITRQNESQLAQVSIDILFISGRRYKLHDVDKLLDMSPVGGDLTRSLIIELVYLVNFPGMSFPVRQVVRVSVSKSRGSKSFDVGLNSETKEVVETLLGLSAEVEIEYYERTWAEDIVNLCKTVLDNHSPPYNRSGFFRRGAGHFAEELHVLGSCIIALVYCIAASFAGSSIDDEWRTALSTAASTDQLKIILLELVDYRSNASFLATVVAFLATGIFVVAAFNFILSYFTSEPKLPRTRFELFAPDVSEIKRLEAAYRKNFFWSIIAFLLSIAASIIAAYLYEMVFAIN